MYFLDGLPKKTDLKHIKAPAAARHMSRIGRLYLTMPLYEAFVEVPGGRAFAEKVYAQAKVGYPADAAGGTTPVRGDRQKEDRPLIGDKELKKAATTLSVAAAFRSYRR